jgi:hypothetical protein
MRTHASGPIAEHLEGDVYRVYFGSRDENNRTSIGSLEMDIAHPGRIENLSAEPVLSPGTAGHFDDSGASTGCLARVGDKRFLYYLGWNLGVTVPWRNSIGLAVSDAPGEPFRKHSAAPIVDRASVDPFSLSYPWVLRDGDRWRMWYGSNLAWGKDPSSMAHVIKHADSRDGISWNRTGQVVVAGRTPAEYAIARPCVVKDGSLYRMWYSYRGASYRIGYAESPDGVTWERRDGDAGIDVSPSGWDSEAVQYAFVFRHRGRLCMLYNGNKYGATGFGLAYADE